MIGLDTNILARYILNDDPRWSSVVKDFLEQRLSEQKPGYVNPITLVELVWTLRRRPGYDRYVLADVLEGLLNANTLIIGEADAVRRALVSFKAGNGGFADYLIAELNSAAGASPTMTLDRRAARTPSFALLSQES